MKNFFAIILISALVVSCARTSLPPITGADGFALEKDEKRLWAQTAEEIQDLDASGALYNDPVLEEYLNGIARKLQPKDVYRVLPFRIKVIKHPSLNAFAYPNGTIYVHTGILARADNEAEFATLVGHEMVHATHRHSIKKWRNLKKKNQIASVVGIKLDEVGLMAAVSGYSREVETEADREGLKLVVMAGYDPRESPKLFEHMEQELEDEKITEPFLYSTHPHLSARIENYRELLESEYKGRTGVTNADLFRKNIRKLILDNAWLDLQRGRFATVERNVVSYVGAYPADARGYYLLGELYRQKGQQGDTEKAEQNYRKAISCDPRHADPYKALGLIQYKKGDKKTAQKNLRTYLTLSPQSRDRAYLESYIHDEN